MGFLFTQNKIVLVLLCCSLCLTLCDPMDCGPPGCSVQEILQARILEWVARGTVFESKFQLIEVQHYFCLCVCTCAQLLSQHLTPCRPIDCSPPGSCVHGILQARILEWLVHSSSPPQPGQLIAEQATFEISLALIIGWSEGTEHKGCGHLNFFKRWCQRISAQREKRTGEGQPSFQNKQIWI